MAPWSVFTHQTISSGWCPGTLDGKDTRFGGAQGGAQKDTRFFDTYFRAPGVSHPRFQLCHKKLVSSRLG
jgi:hypothetical protein